MWLLAKKKRVANMTDREHRQAKKEWKKKKAEYRQKQKELAERENNMLTPDSSAAPSPEPSTSKRGDHMTRQKKRKVAKCYRDNSKLKEQLEAQKRLNESLRKKLKRIKQEKIVNTTDSPRSKTKRLLRNFSRAKSETIRKTLFHHFTLTQELRKKYREGNHSKKSTLSSLLAHGKLIRKYKLVNTFRMELRFFSGSRNRNKKGCLSKRVAKKVRQFYERDDNSRVTAGIKDTVTEKKIKQQRRILTKTLEQFYKQFKYENAEIRISYSTFCRLRPFWVLPPRESDRETCICKQHDNMQFLANSLYKEQLVDTSDLYELLKIFSCDTNKKQCMYGQCSECKDIKIQTKDLDQSGEVKWNKWQAIQEKRNIKGVDKVVKLTVKLEESGTISELVETFSKEMVSFKQHSFNITNQMEHYRHVKENLSENEVLIHIDFSENYACKMAREIHTLHFGASKHQVTLHTGVYYTTKGMQTFCAVSDSLEHGPSGIWAYLDPVLDRIFNENRKIDTVHFYSDGPSAQYKQKGNFFLLSNAVTKRNMKIGVWNFHESGHGKGVPDGVGGSVKRTANNLVLQGNDIQNASDFVHLMNQQNSAVYIYKVNEDKIDVVRNVLESQKLKPVPKTQKLHQIKTTGNGEMWYRDVSCFCGDTETHDGHDWNFFKLSNKAQRKSKSNETESSEDQHEHEDIENQAKYINDLNIVEDERNIFFESSLKELEKCSYYKDIEKKCAEITDNMQKFQIDEQYLPSIMSTGLLVDEDAIDIFPADTIQDQILYPVQVRGDGNCLPYTGSIHAFGNDQHGTEIRVRIIVEAVIHKNIYLSHNYLEQGTSGSANLPKAFAMYSDEYTPPNRLDLENIERIYEQEVIKITKDKQYMGIWQIFALSSVLGRCLFSVYPKLGNNSVRQDLHRLIKPREAKSVTVSYIMWSSTRKDLTSRNWVPNHFVAVLPITLDEVTPLNTQRYELLKQRKLEREQREQLEKKRTEEKSNPQVIVIDGDDSEGVSEKNNTERDSKKPQETDATKRASDQQLFEDENSNKNVDTANNVDDIELETETMKCDKQDEKIESENSNKNVDTPNNVDDIELETETMECGEPDEKIESENSNKIETETMECGEPDEKIESEKVYESADRFSPNELINLYVLVRYNNKFYPGVVLDVNDEEVYIRCMRLDGKSKTSVENCKFYWSKGMKDECWYGMQDVLAIIPEPKLVDRKYEPHQKLLRFLKGQM